MIRIRHIMEYFLCSRSDPFRILAVSSKLGGLAAILPSKIEPEAPCSVMLSLEFNPHTIIPRLNVWRQLGAQFGVVEIAVHVGEDRTPGADAVDPLQRQVKVEMARMRPVP